MPGNDLFMHISQTAPWNLITVLSVCLKDLDWYQSPKKKKPAYAVLSVQRVLKFVFMGRWLHLFLTLHLSLCDGKMPRFWINWCFKPLNNGTAGIS